MNKISDRFRTGLRASTVAALMAWAMPLAWAGGMDSLETFIKSTRSGKAAFTQVVTAPAKDGQQPRARTQNGSFEFQRPGKFRFVYSKPFEQTIVADGQTLWLHDVDLNQVTARAQEQVLGSTPAAIVAAAPDLKALERDFTLTEEPDADGQQWVKAVPKSRDGQLQSIRVGFKAGARGAELATLDILDSFGQRSVLSFSDFDVNAAVPASHFQFKPPAGADVLRN
ncbi:outer membrane lipoprotein chaperone LolA [Ottowia sp.]|uniref:outer membrane lipoprotein chaperone LolA n=1 Tax=Ottowia sp. TaxID=1898956 RepID=UPI002C88A3DA|nr:outer membrane lipoprotein chaperone LolA [Ottowia sp.]HRN75202.1 outer membrane lipoprotein chaperone LolA [Ottowia sp.]HRQ01651.1 outer membrane lipoprotein chaperone LolA [Ottowia sp.]